MVAINEETQQILERYKCKIDPNNEDLEEIKYKIDGFFYFLNTKRYNTIMLAKSIYTLRMQVERICRYREYGNYKNLSSTDCDDLWQYVHDCTLEFLSKPVEGSDIYLYSALTNGWIVVSPGGHLWLIYGDTVRQIHLLGRYLLSIINENPNLLELKQAKEFTDKFVSTLSFIENKPLLSILIDDENFMQCYEYIHNAINKESARDRTF